MKETFYFQHDFNARNDPKLQSLLMEKGVAGIGVYWCIIEQLYEQGGVLSLAQCKSIAFALHIESKDVESVIKDFDLFQNDGENFWSESVNSRLSRRKEISEKRKSAAISSWKSRGQMQMQSNCNENSDTCNAIKEKERKEKYILISDKSDNADSHEKVNFDEIVSMYHRICISFPRIMKLTDERKKKIKSRIEEMKGDMAVLETVFTKMQNSDFMRNGSWASFDWIFKNPQNWMKVYEGNYDNKPAQGKKQTQVNDIWPTQ